MFHHSTADLMHHEEMDGPLLGLVYERHSTDPWCPDPYRESSPYYCRESDHTLETDLQQKKKMLHNEAICAVGQDCHSAGCLAVAVQRIGMCQFRCQPKDSDGGDHY